MIKRIRPSRSTPRSSTRGQALVELAVILPILLGMAGGAVDLARAYSAWLTVESAARNAAEYVAGYSASAATAPTDAQTLVCTETQNLPGFVAGSGGVIATCTSPSVSGSLTTSTTDPGASIKYPIGTAHVTVTLSFHTLVPWPFIPSDGITLRAERTYAIVRGR